MLFGYKDRDSAVTFVRYISAAKSETFSNATNTTSHALRSSQVAIDFPGYGNSPGDRQTIRSYPTEFLCSVVKYLGFPSAYAIVGSSQESCVGFNALSESPGFSANLICIHPISTSSSLDKYRAITSPCLLVYDTSNPGYPMSVGRYVLRILRSEGTPTLYVEMDNGGYTGEKDSWEDKFLPGLMVRMMEKGGTEAVRADKANRSSLIGGVERFSGVRGFG